VNISFHFRSMQGMVLSSLLVSYLVMAILVLVLLGMLLVVIRVAIRLGLRDHALWLEGRSHEQPRP
jgi:hypothetical protein